MYDLIISAGAILFLIYLFFRFRWYNMHFQHFLYVMNLFLFCKKRKNEFEERTQTKPFLSMLFCFWNWDFGSYVIHRKTWLEANIFFIELVSKMNDIAHNEAEKIRNEAV